MGGVSHTTKMRKRADGRTRIQVWVDDDVYNMFCDRLIDEYGHVDFAFSDKVCDLMREWGVKGGGNIDTQYEVKKNYLVKLRKVIPAILENMKDKDLWDGRKKVGTIKIIKHNVLFGIIEEFTDSTDAQRRTQERYRKILRKCGLLGDPLEQWTMKDWLEYPVNIEKAEALMEKIKIIESGKDKHKDLIVQHLVKKREKQEAAKQKE